MPPIQRILDPAPIGFLPLIREGELLFNAMALQRRIVDGTTLDQAIVDVRGASEPYTAGTFPEITEYLRSQGTNFTVAYLDSSRDSLTGTTWTYSRGNNRVIVHDIPRTIFRLTIG